MCLWKTCASSSVEYQGKFCSRACKNKYYVDNRRRQLKLDAVTLKGGCCQLCGYRRCIAALEFHHLDPTQKEFKIGSGDTYSWAKLVTELGKCQLLCSNCHRETHSGVVFTEFE